MPTKKAAVAGHSAPVRPGTQPRASSRSSSSEAAREARASAGRRGRAGSGFPKEVLVDRPALTDDLLAEHRACITSGSKFGTSVVKWLATKSPEQQAAWIKASVAAGGVAFQPWSTEILFVLALSQRARFTELQRLLGISSRTLSDKLQMLEKEGLVERVVYDERPVRIEYGLTKVGARFAALATPIYCMLVRNAEEAGR
ncbi:MAG TPA: helix-turn-helix domain-containing protein [Candidatus Thermoplasmatota archaeon]|nr:helix-turn-helix domain-containing protein [Candidatus Thermoplasmatota archaeon]